jgi:hypothetical protein
MKANNKIPRAGMWWRAVLCVALALFFLSAAMPATVSYARSRVKGEWVLPKFYPESFDGWGRIDRITEDMVVIDDTMIKLSPSIVYRTPTNTHATSAYFKPGNLVGFMTNATNEIVSLWLIKK